MLKELSEDEDKMQLFFGALNYGMFDEWDCNLSHGLQMFGPTELSVAVKTASMFAADQEG